MNLKLEKGSLRVRVSFDEARILARDGRLMENLPMPGGDFILEISCIPLAPLSVQAGNSVGIQMSLPREGLNAILEALNGERVEKFGLELCASVEIGTETVKIAFEVDRFTIAKNGLRARK